VYYFPYVIVEGLIGIGKSSLVSDLGAALDRELDLKRGQRTLILLEPDEANGNPYLADFYADKQRWGFTMQIRLLAKRFQMQLQAAMWAESGQGPAIVDRSYFGDTCFAHMLHESGDIDDRDFETYEQIYSGMTFFAKYPSICIRLMSPPHLVAQRIQRRMEEREGRKCENVIDLDYLRALDTRITTTTTILREMGVQVLDYPWEVSRPTEESRAEAVEGLVHYIKEWHPNDAFLDRHRRMVYGNPRP
jgi:deoxyadenosine kinase